MGIESEIAVQYNVTFKLAEFAKSCPDKTILVFPYRSRATRSKAISYRRTTFAKFETSVNHLANSLKNLGLTKGDRAVVMVSMSTDLYITLVALFKMGVTAVFIDPWAQVRQMIRCCELAEPRAFIGTRKSHLLRIASNVLRRIPIKIVSGGPAFPGETRLQDLIEFGGGDFETESVSKQDTALITFTTGSTGVPKGVNRSHGFLLAQQKVLSKNIRLTPEDVDLPALPIFVLKNMASNVMSVLPMMNFLKVSDVDPALIVQQIIDWGVTTSIGSPAFFEPIANFCLERDIRLEQVRAVYAGGAPVKPELIEILTEILPNGTAHVVYGSTEAEPISVVSAQQVLEENANRSNEGRGNLVGRPVGDAEVRIIRATDAPVDLARTPWDEIALPDGAIGEVVVAGEHVNRDYYKSPRAFLENKVVERQGTVWHRTGDAGCFDSEGRLWLAGRVKDRVERAGKVIYPLQVESIVDQLPFVKRSALIGLPDAELGQKAVLVVEPLKKGSLGLLRSNKRRAREIKDLCVRKGLLIDEIRFCKCIPLDPRHNAKIERHKIVKRFH